MRLFPFWETRLPAPEQNALFSEASVHRTDGLRPDDFVIIDHDLCGQHDLARLWCYNYLK